jgi:hypothetical protein
MKPFKTKLKLDALEALHDYLDGQLRFEVNTDDEKLHFACLAEVKKILYIKLAKVQQDYQCSFTPAQAIALRILSTNYVVDVTSFLGNKLHQLSNQINQHYI